MSSHDEARKFQWRGYVLVVIAIVLLGVVGCMASNRRSDDPPSTPIPTSINRGLPSQSSFELTREASPATPATVHDLDEPYGGWETNDGMAFVLDEDGTAIIINPDGTTGIGVWTIDGNTLCLIGGGEEVCETYKQDGDTMTFSGITFYRR